eukprot:365764-Chlamydomonas_euryale.AAC.7
MVTGNLCSPFHVRATLHVCTVGTSMHTVAARSQPVRHWRTHARVPVTEAAVHCSSAVLLRWMRR